MPSDRKKKKAAAAKDKAKNRGASAKESAERPTETNGAASSIVLSNRACTGVLASTPLSRDVHIASLTVLFHGHELLQDSVLELNYGR